MKLKQSHVDFNESAHTYHLNGKELQGITSTLIKAVFGEDKINRFRIREGQTVYVDFNVFAYESNGRWYNSVRASDVRLREPVQVPTQVEQEPQESEEPTNDLPF